MKIRVGMEGGRRTVLDRAKELGAPILVSANSMWDNRAKRFNRWRSYQGHDTALDSGGFIAMKLYGGYRWSPEQYVGLVQAMKPTWWAQMDLCCEPEIAADAPAVTKRIDGTVTYLHACQRIARETGAPAPMPVLQGWKPEDYTSGPAYAQGFEWPALVGVGSVCRRHVEGPTGLLAVVRALHQAIPDHVGLHLFGVKSTALARLLREFPARSFSVDSMAWRYGGKRAAWKAGQPWDRTTMPEAMAAWYLKQRATVDAVTEAQLNLDGVA